MLRSIFLLSTSSSLRSPTGGTQILPVRPLTPLKTLNTEGLCALLDHEHVPEFKPFVQWHGLTGADFEMGIKCCDDLHGLGLSKIKAETLFNTVSEWKHVDTPVALLAPCVTTLKQDDPIRTVSAFAEDQLSKSVHEWYRSVRYQLNYKPELQKLLQEADSGNHVAQLYVNILFKDDCLDSVTATPYFPYVEDALIAVRVAAEASDPFAQLALALWYDCKGDVQEDRKECERLLELAAAQGLSCAQYELAEFYSSNRDPMHNNVYKRHKFNMLAAKQGDACALYSLGNCSEHGLGTGKDEEQALLYFKMAAFYGHQLAQYYVAQCYEEGKLGVQRDETKAKKYRDMWKESILRE